MKWFTCVEVVDTETGEITDKKHYDKTRTRIIQKVKKVTIINENYGEIKYTWETKRHEQEHLDL